MSNKVEEPSGWGKSDKILDAVIIGTGFAGICMGIRFKQEKDINFIILEKSNGVGGTWRDNTYPGAACDVQSHLYSFSFEPNPNWSRMFGVQKEILEYMNHCVDKYNIREHIQFNTSVKGTYYDEKNGFWRVVTNENEIFFCRTLISATGGLSQPSYPKIKGLEQFQGKIFHSARWDHNYSLEGKKVAVIGTGASAIQIVPSIANKVKELNLFQRTPPWIIPKPDREITPNERILFKTFPFLQYIERSKLYWAFEFRVLGLVLYPELMKQFQKTAELHINNSIQNEELKRKITPDYTIGCKRILMSNEYYTTLEKSNVSVITNGIQEITKTGLLTLDGKHHEVDLIITATGFETAEALSPYEVIGREGKNLNSIWEKNGSEAYLGTSIHGFPNFLILVGPNTGLGHSSMILMIESQVQYALEVVKAIKRNSWKSMEVTNEAQFRYNIEMQRRLSKTIWSSGNCKSWYHHSNGKNNTLWPSFTFEFMARTLTFAPDDYLIETQNGEKHLDGALDVIARYASVLV